MAQFKVGDVVQLKSGGPKMTVNTVLSLERVKCTWFEGSKQVEGVFGQDALQKAG